MLEFETIRRETGTVAALTGATGTLTELVVPDEAAVTPREESADGSTGKVPVAVIAPHAFAGYGTLRRVSLAAGIDTLGAFAFHNCGALREIALSDGVTDYGDGVIRQCTALSEVRLTVRKNNYALMARMLADSDNTLTFTLFLPDGEACLTFPGFLYDFNENTMARTIQFNIEGSGMAFRECVSRAGVDFASYDKMFSRAKLDDITIITKLVLSRLMFPYALSEQARTGYEDYIRAHDSAVLETLVREKNTEKLRFLTGCGEAAGSAGLLDGESARNAAILASERGLPEITALLTDYNARRHGTGRRRTLSIP